MFELNLNEIVFNISKDVAQHVENSDKGKILGKEVTIHVETSNKRQILQNEATMAVDPSSPQKKVISEVMSQYLQIMSGQEISSAHYPAFEQECSHLNSIEIQKRISAYESVIDFIESSRKTSSLYQSMKKNLTEQKEYLSHLCDPIASIEVTVPPSIPPSSKKMMTEKDARELMESFEGLRDDYLELSQNINQVEKLEELTPEQKTACFRLSQQEEEVTRLRELFPSLKEDHAKDAEQLQEIVHAMDKIKGLPFIQELSRFDALYKKCNKEICNESGNVEMYLKKMLNNSNQLDTAIQAHQAAHRPMESFLGTLPTEELKFTFYCIAKYQDQIQEIATIMTEKNISHPDIPLNKMTMLAHVAARTAPLKKHFANENQPIILSRSETLGLAEAEKCKQEAFELLKGGFTPESSTTIHELLWRAALGFIQNGRTELANECIALAAKNTQPATEGVFLGITDRLAGNAQHGTYLSGFGTSYNKEQAVHLTECLIDDTPILKIDFELTGHGLLGLKTCLTSIDLQNPNTLMNRLPSGFCSGVEIFERSQHHYTDFIEGQFRTDTPGYKMPNTSQIVYEFKGVGKVIIGNCPGVKCIENQVYVEAIPKDSIEETLSNIKIMLTALGMPPVLVQSRKEDVQKKALLHVFRSFFPREAAHIERDGKTFQIPPQALQELIVQMQPEMRDLFRESLDDNLLPRKVTTIVGGKTTTRVNISDKMREKGALGLMAGMDGTVESRAPLLSKMLRPTEQGGIGMISSQMRFSKGIISIGQSSYTDHKEGGASGVFTRLITKELAEKKRIDDMVFHGSIQLLIDLEAANKPSTYGFDSDAYGTRSGGPYFSRLNLIELTETLQKPREERFGRPIALEKYGTANEIVIRDSIPPEHIVGICVQSEAEKQILIRQFQADGILIDRNRVPCLGSVPIADYIKVGNKFTQEMWNG